MRRRSTSLVILAALSVGSPALADELPRALRLEVSRGPGTDACPADDVVHDVLAARMSWDPIDAAAPVRLTVALSRRGRAYTGRAAIVDARGVTSWERPPVTLDDCASVVDGLGFAAAIHLDPAGPPAGQHPRPAPAPPAPLPVPVRPDAAPVVVEPVAVLTWPRWRVGASGGVAFGVSPAPVAGLVGLDVGLRWPVLSVGIEARVAPHASAALATGETLATGLYGAAATGCGHWRILAGCGVFDVAGFRATSSATHPGSGFVASVRVGLRGGVEVPVGSTFSLRLSGDALLPIQRGAAAIDGRVVWTAPILAGALQAGIAANF